ncbi:DUF2066 domain-containing protein [Zavarzinia sp.]|uniref:DUF2066 domain-containing protein n=1 Tax=Zavarzinia sp. TaxID=2027920 RepID=UPI003BB61976
MARLFLSALLGALLLALPARAETYSVEGVVAQATAADPLAARDAATTKAQREALDTLLKRLAAQGGAGRLPPVTDQLVFQTMQGFEVQQEKTTATSYSAILTVEFRREAIDQLLAGAGVDYVEAADHPLAVVPLFIGPAGPVLFEGDNPWRAAWDRRNTGADALKLVIPQGDLADLQALNPEAARQGDVAGLTQIAQHYDASGAIVAQATESANGLAVSVGDAGQAPFYTGSFPAGAYDQAATAAAAAVQERYRSQNAVPAGPPASLQATAVFAGLKEWQALKAAIQATPGVRKVSVRKLMVGKATVIVDYQGEPAGLRNMLSQRGVGLDLGAEGWQLHQGIGSSVPAPGLVPDTSLSPQGALAPGAIGQVPLSSPATSVPAAPSPAQSSPAPDFLFQ